MSRGARLPRSPGACGARAVPRGGRSGADAGRRRPASRRLKKTTRRGGPVRCRARVGARPLPAPCVWVGMWCASERAGEALPTRRGGRNCPPVKISGGAVRAVRRSACGQTVRDGGGPLVAAPVRRGREARSPASRATKGCCSPSARRALRPSLAKASCSTLGGGLTGRALSRGRPGARFRAAAPFGLKHQKRCQLLRARAGLKSGLARVLSRRLRLACEFGVSQKTLPPSRARRARTSVSSACDDFDPRRACRI